MKVKLTPIGFFKKAKFFENVIKIEYVHKGAFLIFYETENEVKQQLFPFADWTVLVYEQ